MDMDQQFSLSWNNFHGNLSRGFSGLLGRKEFVDVTLAVDGHLLQAHKVILSICSPYFKKMFQTNPCQHPIVVLRDVSHKAMRDLLQFMYHGEVSVKREDLTSFIGTAEVLQIKGLTNKEVEEDSSDTEQDTSQKPSDLEANNKTLQSDTFKENCNNDITHPIELIKQSQLIDKLHRLSNLKRKSEEYLQKNYYAADLINSEKRPKFREKLYDKQNFIQHHFENFTNQYTEDALETNDEEQKTTNDNNDKDKDLDEIVTDNNIELKTECDESDIVVTDPAVCSPVKNYENVSHARRNSSLPLDYTPPQESAMPLVMNDSDDHQLPIRYKYIYSRKGHKQLVYRNFVYTKHSTTHGKTSWRCVQYFSLNRCPATVETIDSMIYAVNHQHNHEDCYEKLLKNNVYEMNVDSK